MSDIKAFMDEDFLLDTKVAQKLYHEHAAGMPIYDYHCHLSIQEIAQDRQFDNMSQVWLAGDHYKWRAMRTNGVDEKFITGNGSDEDKFMAWAKTVPATLRNPLYHWTHMELRKPFGIKEVLNGDSAAGIYANCNTQLQDPAFSCRGLIKQAKVKLICTTDDPVDSLEHHARLHAEGDWGVKVYPAMRPDKAMAVEDPLLFNEWVNRLEAVSNISISTYKNFLEALRKRHDFFHFMGCRTSDHGLEEPYAELYSEAELHGIFAKIRAGGCLVLQDRLKFKSALMHEFAIMDAERGWVFQIHLGALRNNNSRLLEKLGPDTGFDSMGDWNMAQSLSRFLNRLDSLDQLPRTIIYNLNPKDNEMIATMIGNFQDGTIPGKLQYGSGWWFLDQKLGMINQINALSSLGLLSRFVGMLTDSRSFLSYSRHDYFRRILCMLLGRDVANGEIPDDMDLLGKMVKDISFNNAAAYFAMELD